MLPTGVLSVLARQPLHGYGIAIALSERGLGRPRGGSLYPTLAALEESELIAASWQPGDAGPGRRIYELTGKGRSKLESEREMWAALVAVLGDEQDVTVARDED